MLRFAFRCARFRYWYIGRFSEKFPVERKKDSFFLLATRKTRADVGCRAAMVDGARGLCHTVPNGTN